MKKPGKTSARKSAGRSRAKSSSSRSGGSSRSGSGAGSGSAQSADKLLMADHRTVEQLFSKYEGLTDSSEKAECVQQICKELVIHALLEEELFYPACREEGVKSDMLDEAQVEHDGAKVMIRDLLSGDPEEEFYDAKVSVLSEYIKHHVAEEEKRNSGIFALARKAGLDMEAIGSELMERKEELLQQIDDQPPPPPEVYSINLQAAGMGGQGRMMMGGQQGRGGRSSGRGQGMMRGENQGSYGRGRSSSRGGYEEDEGQGGWFGDSQGHSEASRRGWENRGGGGRSSGYGGQGYGGQGYGGGSRSSGSSRGSRYEEDYSEDRGQGGWFGDSEGHSEASRRGWDQRGGGGGGRYEDEGDDERRGSRGGRGASGGGRDRGQGGWFGDPEGHSEASRRGRGRD